MIRLFIAILVALIILPVAGPARAANLGFTDLIVFGDSLSDPGNFGAGLVATNGQTWAGQLGALPFTTGGTNFAYGGATAVSNGDFSPDFTEQRAIYDSVRPALGTDPLTVVWFGGNDLLNAADPSAIPNAIGAIGAGIQDLAVRFGLTRFIVPGLPDLGLIPRNLGTPFQTAATLATNAFNGALQSLAAAAPAGVSITYLDTNSVFLNILADPAAAGFSNVTGHCQQGAVSCDGFVFWDDIHPTAATHALLADLVQATVAPVPLPAAGWLMLAALGGLGVMRKRRALV